MPPKREKRKRIDEFRSPSLHSTSTYDLISPDSDEEDEEEEDSESDYSGYNKKSRGKGRAKTGRQEVDEIPEDILYKHRSVSTEFIPGLTSSSARNVNEAQRMSCSKRLGRKRGNRKAKRESSRTKTT